jgi:type I restriction enzyme, S subunit
MIDRNTIPKHWELKRLCEVGEIISGGTPSTKEPQYWNGNIAWITPADLSGFRGKKIAKGKKSISKRGLSNSSARLMPKGSVLFSSRAPIGYVAIASNELCTNQGFKSVIPNESINSEFLFYFLKASKNNAEKVASGTTFKEISSKIFSRLEIPLPPLSEQQQIVSKIEELFSELDKGKQQLETVRQQLKTYRQAVLKWAFEGRFTNVGTGRDMSRPNNILNTLPEGWKWVKIAELGKIKGGKRLPKGETYADQQTQFPYIRVTDFENQTVNYQKLKYLKPQTQLKIKNYTISKDDVYISIAGSIGLSGTIPEILNGANLTENAAKITELKEIYNKYLAWFLSSILGQEQIKANTIATTQSKLSLFRIEKIGVPLPPIDIQKMIVQSIENRLSICDKIEEIMNNCLQQTVSLRQSILKQAFEGKLI